MRVGKNNLSTITHIKDVDMVKLAYIKVALTLARVSDSVPRGLRIIQPTKTLDRSRSTRKKPDRKIRRRARKLGSDDSSPKSSSQRLTRQTKKLIDAIRDHVLPLLRVNPDSENGHVIGKNRMLFALNRAAERALTRRAVFGNLKQLEAEAREADDIVEEFLEKDDHHGYGPQVSLVAPKCALCGANCQRCVRVHLLYFLTTNQIGNSQLTCIDSLSLHEISHFAPSPGSMIIMRMQYPCEEEKGHLKNIEISCRSIGQTRREGEVILHRVGKRRRRRARRAYRGELMRS